MKEKRHISTEMKLIIGIVGVILIFVVLLYIYNNHFLGRSVKDNTPLFIMGVVIILILLISHFAIIVLFVCLIGKITSKKSYLKSKD